MLGLREEKKKRGVEARGPVLSNRFPTKRKKKTELRREKNYENNTALYSLYYR